MMAHPFKEAFERCAPLLARSLKCDHHPETLRDVYAEIAAGRAQLWEGDEAVAVTQVTNDTQAGLVITLWIVAGDIKKILAMLPGCEAWARVWGCKECRLAPERQAWMRVLAPYGYRDIGKGIAAKVLN